MSNFVIFGSTQSGKSTLAGYIASDALSDQEFNNAVAQNKRLIEKMGVGPMTKEMVYVSFASLDRDELRKCRDTDSIGTTKRTHRKSVLLTSEEKTQDQKLIMIDTPGVRSESKERYMGIFEGDIGICMLNIRDLENYVAYSDNDNFAKRSADRRLFDPIRFWCAYKRIQDLVIVVSQIDRVQFDEDKIKQAVCLIRNKLVEYGLNAVQVPIIPISIRLRIKDGVFQREVYNVKYVNMYPSEYKNALLPTIVEKGIFSRYPPDSNFFASISNLYRIKNGNGFAFRIKVLNSTISLDSRVIIGPLKHSQNKTLHYVTGKIKSLKDENEGRITQSIATGSIGGVCFSDVYDASFSSQPSFSKMVPVEDYKVLRTTVMVEGEFRSGNAITLKIPDDELGESSFLAINQLLPKETLSFFWFGKRIVADVVELYHEKDFWFMTLCPLTSAYQNATGQFTVPLGFINKRHPSLETLVILPLIQRGNGITTSFQNYVDFTIEDVRLVPNDAPHNIHLRLQTDDFDYLCEDFMTRLEDDKVIEISSSEKLISINHFSFETLGYILKVIRHFIRDNNISEYDLRLE